MNLSETSYSDLVFKKLAILFMAFGQAIIKYHHLINKF